MESNNLELVKDVINFITTDAPEFKERDSGILFSTIFEGATKINIKDDHYDDDNYKLEVFYQLDGEIKRYVVFVVKDHFSKWNTRDKVLTSLGI